MAHWLTEFILNERAARRITMKKLSEMAAMDQKTIRGWCDRQQKQVFLLNIEKALKALGYELVVRPIPVKLTDDPAISNNMKDLERLTD